jgi:hypothetical protein
MVTTKKQLQTGGAGSACVLPTNNLSKYMYRSCLDANLHNRNPVTNYSLMEGAGALPTMTGGAGKRSGKTVMDKIKKYSKRKMYAQIPTSMTQTKQKKSAVMTGGFGCPTSARPIATFREYLERAAMDIGATSDKKSVLTGGSGYVVNPGMGIAGLPEILKYDSCCPPAMLGRSIVMDPVGSTCGPLAQTGGAVAGQVPIDSIEYSANKIAVNNKSITNMTSAKSSKRRSAGRKGNKNHTKKAKKGRKSTMRGGAPANYPESLNGEPGDFRYQGDDLTYGGRQPFWSTKDR